MSDQTQTIVIGQGLAGSAMAWMLHWSGKGLLIVDDPQEATASRVSAGLITPLTGKRLVKSEDFSIYWESAVRFYRKVEAETGTKMFEEKPMLKLFRNQEARTEYQKNSDEETDKTTKEWEGELQKNGDIKHGIQMEPAGRLDVRKYLAATRKYFEDRGQLIDGEVEEVQTSGGTVKVKVGNQLLSGERVVYCTGATVSQQFPDVPNNPSRGDILTVSIPQYSREEVVHRSVWIASESDDTQLVGSTYDWRHLTSEPTEAGRQEILGQLGRMIDGEVKVHDQRAAVRPTMKDYEPVVGQHPEREKVFVFNGLGSKGVLRSPMLAERLLSFMKTKASLPGKWKYSRLQALNSGRAKPLTRLAQEAVAEVLKEGDTAIDGTVGNGFDTCFLAEQVGSSGHVIGFDLQQQAIDSTRRRLAAKELQNVKLLEESHEKLGGYSQQSSVTAVMFNLGYLPRSDKAIATKPESSVFAISAALDALKKGGILTVLAYRGHEGGPEEFAAVRELLNRNSNSYDLSQTESGDAKSTSPVLFIVRKS